MARLKKRADGYYRKVVYIGTVDGKQKRKYFSGKTLKEVEAAAAEYKAAIGKGFDPASETATLATLFDALLASKKAKGVGASQLKNINIYKNHWRPLLNSPAKDLRASHFQTVINAKAEWHDGKPPLAHSTLKEICATAKAAYALAIPETIAYNPMDKVIVPAGNPPKFREALTEQQQAWVRDTPHNAQTAAMLMMYSGLRRGEATALTNADIDLNEGTVTVNKNYDFVGKKSKSPKTEAGERIVNIPSVLVDYLKNRPADSCIYVLHNAKGKPYTAQAWRTLWRSYMADLNVKYGYNNTVNKFAANKKIGKNEKTGNAEKQGALPKIIKTFTPHELRHTFCTMLYLAGVDVMTARDQMGHASAAVTMEIYTHLDKKYKRHNMNKLDEYVKSQCGKDGGRSIS